MAKARPPLSAEALAWFRRQGARGGKLGGSLGGRTAADRMSKKARVERARQAGRVGGKRALETMTPEQRASRARKAGLAAAAARRVKGKAGST